MNILMLSTYPVQVGIHGGQMRVAQLVNAYRRTGHHVQLVGVLGSENYRETPGFEPFPGVEALRDIVSNPFLMEDYAIGAWYAASDQRVLALGRHVTATPDLIQVEHPWLFDAAARLAELKGWHEARFVYSAHNIEHRLKQNVLWPHCDQRHIASCVELIEAVERRAIRQADGIIAVSTEDQEWIAANSSAPVLLAPNGVIDRQSDAPGRVEAQRITGEYRYALYCASAHPPNLEGFFSIFGGGFGSLAPDERLVVAGGAGLNIATDPRNRESALAIERSLLPGYVSDGCLAALLENAHCVVLPVTQGGGTNLKTAEALWAGKHIVATPLAFRGFEQFTDGEGVHLCASPVQFKKTLRHVMAQAPLTLSSAERDRRRAVLWEACLINLPRWVAEVASSGVAA